MLILLLRVSLVRCLILIGLIKVSARCSVFSDFGRTLKSQHLPTERLMDSSLLESRQRIKEQNVKPETQPNYPPMSSCNLQSRPIQLLPKPKEPPSRLQRPLPQLPQQNRITRTPFPGTRSSSETSPSPWRLTSSPCSPACPGSSTSTCPETSTRTWPTSATTSRWRIRCFARCDLETPRFTRQDYEIAIR